jgi:hypothetical protein
MANSFFVILPSTTPNPSDEDANKPNRFRVHLPKKLEFYDGTWLCGLSSIVYPNSWPAIGTIETQYLDIYLKEGEFERFLIPSGSFTTPKVLEKSLYNSILAEIDKEEKVTSAREKGRPRKRAEDVRRMPKPWLLLKLHERKWQWMLLLMTKCPYQQRGVKRMLKRKQL